jgi:hypothetical protein
VARSRRKALDIAKAGLNGPAVPVAEVWDGSGPGDTYEPPPPAGDERVVFETLATLKAKPVRYAVPKRVPWGKLVLVAGDGGTGKSTWARHLAARLTTGRPAFGADYATPPPCTVIMFAAEDGWEDVVIPSLVAEGADLNRVVRVPYVESEKDGKPARVVFGLEHLAALKAKLAERPDVRCIIIDPIASFVGRCRIDDHKASELRQVLDPLNELAESTGVLILVLAHVNKASAAKAVYRIAGSTAYVTAVRLAYLLGQDPDDDSRRLLMPVKKNLLGVADDAVAFRLVRLDPSEVETHRRHPAFSELADDDFAEIADQMARLEFDAPVAADPNRVMGGRQPDGDGRRHKREQCVEWLAGFLAEYAYPSEEVFAAGDLAGFSKALVYTARKAFNERTEDAGQVWATNKANPDGAYWWGIGNPRQWRRRPEPGSEGEEDGIEADLRRDATS